MTRNALYAAATALVIASPAWGAPAADSALNFVPVGDADAVCHGGILPGYARQLRNALGCLIARSATLTDDPGPAGQELDTLKKRLLVRNFRGLSDEQARKWVEDPSGSLIPRAGFQPERFARIEFAKASPGVTYRYINPTGARGAGLTFGEYTGDFVFRAQLIARVEGHEAELPVEGVFRPSNIGAWIVSISRVALPT